MSGLQESANRKVNNICLGTPEGMTLPGLFFAGNRVLFFHNFMHENYGKEVLFMLMPTCLKPYPW